SVCTRNLPGRRQAGAAADEPGRRDAVMWRTKGRRPVQRAVTSQLSEQAANQRDLERLLQFQRRKDAGQASRQHRLASARRAAHEEVMATGGRDLERPLRLLLAMDLGKVDL